MGSAYTQLGAISFESEALDDAYFYWKKAEKFVLSHTSLARLNLNFGGIFLKKEAYDKAIQFFKKALNGYKTNPDLFVEGKIYQNIGICYYSQEKYNLALTQFEKAFEIYQRIKEVYHLVDINEYLGYTFWHINRPDEMHYHLLSAIEGLIQFQRFKELQHLLKNTSQMNPQIDLQKIVHYTAAIWHKEEKDIWEIVNST